MMWDFIAAFLTGVLASMGVGGGMILIIYLTVFMGRDQLSAQGINLIFFIPIAALAVFLHTRNKLIKWKKLFPAIITGVVFAAAGAFAAELIGSDILRKIYGFFILAVGVRELFTAKKLPPEGSSR
ncbi:MAG: sulfite exporter TauE/SafE family protein [Oscillospiraceae bacterium]|nr:sulfite exporter TauE/SafE family protein [Oscillospiraceae bacterium]